MGVMPRKLGEQYVVTSDRHLDGTLAKSAPKKISDTYQVWTGDRWSAQMEDAKVFPNLDDAEEYVRANYTRVMA